MSRTTFVPYVATLLLGVALFVLGAWKSNVAALALSVVIFIAAPAVFAARLPR